MSKVPALLPIFLRQAIENKSNKIFDFIIGMPDFNLNHLDENGVNCFWYAVISKNIHAVQSLMSFQQDNHLLIDVTCSHPSIGTALHASVEYLFSSAFSDLTKALKENKLIDYEAITPATTELPILSLKTELNHPRSSDNHTPLHIAISKNSVFFV